MPIDLLRFIKCILSSSVCHSSHQHTETETKHTCKCALQVRIAINKDGIAIKNDLGISVGIDLELDKDREGTFSRMLSLLYKVASVCVCVRVPSRECFHYCTR